MMNDNFLLILLQDFDLQYFCTNECFWKDNCPILVLLRNVDMSVYDFSQTFFLTK